MAGYTSDYAQGEMDKAVNGKPAKKVGKKVKAASTKSPVRKGVSKAAGIIQKITPSKSTQKRQKQSPSASKPVFK